MEPSGLSEGEVMRKAIVVCERGSKAVDSEPNMVRTSHLLKARKEKSVQFLRWRARRIQGDFRALRFLS